MTDKDFEQICYEYDLARLVSIHALEHFGYERASEMRYERVTDSGMILQIAVIFDSRGSHHVISCRGAKWCYNITEFERLLQYQGMYD